MGSAAAISAPLSDRGLGVAGRGRRRHIAAGGGAAVMSLSHLQLSFRKLRVRMSADTHPV